MRDLSLNKENVTRNRQTRYRWLLTQGLCAIAFGLITLIWPKLTFTIFLFVFGIYAIIEGALLIISALSLRKMSMAWRDHRTPVEPGAWLIILLEGLLTVAVGVLCLFAPRLSAQIALYIVALWTLMLGISLVLHAPQRGWPLAITGLLAVVMGMVLFLEPIRVVQSILWLVGIVALVTGVLSIVHGWRLRSRQNLASIPEIY